MNNVNMIIVDGNDNDDECHYVTVCACVRMPVRAYDVCLCARVPACGEICWYKCVAHCGIGQVANCIAAETWWYRFMIHILYRKLRS